MINFPYDVSDRHITVISNLKDFKVVWHMFVKKIAREISTISRAPTLYAAKSGYQYNSKIGLGFPTGSLKLFCEIS